MADSDCPSLIHHGVELGYDDRVFAFAAGNAEGTEVVVDTAISEVELAVVTEEEQDCEFGIVQLAFVAFVVLVAFVEVVDTVASTLTEGYQVGSYRYQHNQLLNVGCLQSG